MSDPDLIAAGERAVAEARRLFDLDIFDPPIGSKHPRAAECLAVIDGIMARNGWRPAGGYKGNGPPQWCGMFAGDCWRAAGLDAKWLPSFFASTTRLHCWATYRDWNEHKNQRPAGDDVRLCAELAPGKPLPFVPRAGDIVIVGDRAPKDGDHVTLMVSFDERRRAFQTISGNGYGKGPRGDEREGISLREFDIDSGKYEAMLVIRPALRDLVKP
jgi:hypothetical protein